MQLKSNLSNIQNELLKLYSNDVSEYDLVEIKKILAKYFANRLEESFEDFCQTNNLSSDDLEKWSYEHNRIKN